MRLHRSMAQLRQTWRCVLCVAAITPCASSAQSAVTESWPEVDVYWQPAVHQRTMLELSMVTERESATREAATRDAAIGLYQDYVSLPFGYIRGGYRYTFSTHDASYRESRIIAEGVGSRKIGSRVRALNRTRVEWRWINGDPSYRVRDRVQVQLESTATHGPAWTPYGTFEAYYDSRFNTVSRLGGRVGAEARITHRLSTDLYVARVVNSRDSPPAVNALGITLKVSY
jgi:Protein of unknown function (DUF2490)